jgi:ribonuclease PH
LLAGLLLTGAGGSIALTGAEFKEEIHQTYPLTADGRIGLDNVNGAVRVTVWDRAEVKLDAVKRSKRTEDLEAVKIEIESKPDRLQIHTRYPDAKGWFGRRRENSTSVEYTLTVPLSTRLDKVSSVNGTVDIDGVRGEVEASTVNGGLKALGLAAAAELSSVNGGIKAGFDRLDGVKSVSLKTVNGGVELDLPAEANADLSASTLNGGISGDVPANKNWPIGSEVKTRLGEGGTKIQVSSVNGGLRFCLAQTLEKN